MCTQVIANRHLVSPILTFSRSLYENFSHYPYDGIRHNMFLVVSKVVRNGLVEACNAVRQYIISRALN